MKIKSGLPLWGALTIASAVSMTVAPTAHAAFDTGPALAAQHARSEELPDNNHAKSDPVYRFPLTGLDSTGGAPTNRPVAVMVENSSAARPQSGLDQADIVYEVLAEGNITRFVAVFQSRSPAVVGPVRSIRPYLVELGAGFDALIVHAGWSQDAMNLIVARNLNHFDQVYGDAKYYWRSPERKMPHNLYTGIGKIREGALDKKMRLEWKKVVPMFAVADAGGEEARPVHSSATHREAANVSLPYPGGYSVSYRYDPGTGLYARFMNGVPHLDKETGYGLTASNILICKAPHRIVDKEGRREVDIHGPGEGYLVQAGKVQEITWQMKEGLLRAYAGGQEVPLAAGQTWVQIMPESTDAGFGAAE